LRGFSNPQGGNNQLVPLGIEKQEAMNDTGDMARNPRIKSDAVKPRQKQEATNGTGNVARNPRQNRKGARNEERHYRWHIIEMSRQRDEVKKRVDEGRRAGNIDDRVSEPET
jgi:hypothetical protein